MSSLARFCGTARRARAVVALLCLAAIGCRPVPSRDVVLSYQEIHRHCIGCSGFELEFRQGGHVTFRGLRACAVPGEHHYRIDAAESDRLVRAFHDARFFRIPRTDRSPIVTHAAAITIGYRDAVRVHETEDVGRDHPGLRALGTRLRDSGRIERFVTPTADLYRELLKSGWDPNTAGPDGENAVLGAVMCGSPDAVRVLLEHGATVSHAALSAAASLAQVEDLALVFESARAAGRGSIGPEIVTVAAGTSGPGLRYLLDRGADANAVAFGSSALTRSVSAGSLENTRLLLSRGADPRVTDSSGQTALHAAAHASNSGFITLLTQAGADANAPDRAGRTPLMHAASRCFDWNVRALLDAGADPVLKSADGRTAAAAAAENQSGQTCDSTRSLLAAAALTPDLVGR